MKANNYTDGSFSSGLTGILDPILVTGSLILVDTAKSWKLPTAPVQGSLVRNLAWPQAKVLIPSGDESTLATSIDITAQPDEVIMQVTPKGGLHGISSRLNQEGTDRIYLNAPSLIRQYLLDHWTDEFYMSICVETTRLALVITPDMAQMASNNNPGANYKMRFGEGANFPSVNGVGPVLTGSVQALGQQFRCNWRSTQTGSTPANLADMVFRFIWGSQAATWQNQAASRILRRFYLENLSVSGRTGAAVMALDQALYTAAIAPGGRYYGDSFNDPATVLP